MRLAVYNVENLFDRAKIMNLESWEEGSPVLERFAELNALLGKRDYSAADKAKMAKLMIELGLRKSDSTRFVILRRNKGGLLKRTRDGGIEIVASGRADWVGSLELRDEPIRHEAVLNTARLIRDLDADILAIVEAENRPALSEFNQIMLPEAGGTAYRHVMVIDGNDQRGIDVGLMCRDGFPIRQMRSHVDDRNEGGRPIFSRDCPEYDVETPGQARLVILINHLKSKGYGGVAASSRRRKEQAARVAEIYRSLRDQGEQYVAVVGDLNDSPESGPLEPLVQATDLKDICEHGSYESGGYPGTWGSSKAKDKIDYILLSPALFGKIKGCGINRKGMWPGVRPRKWNVLPEIKRKRDSASDHGALYVDLDI